MKLVWDTSFLRAFKRSIRENPKLQDKIFAVLECLESNPFTLSLKSHKLRGKQMPELPPPTI